MPNKTILITGATNGIGLETARGLAKTGAHLILVARDAAKGERVVAELKKATQNEQIDLLIADLSRQNSVRALATQVLDRYPRLDVLVNNAGGVFNPRTITADGIETTWAVNHLAYFLLTHLLLDRLKAGAPTRIVSVSSAAHFGGRIRLDDPEFKNGGYNAMGAYSQSKLANILFTKELARRLAGSGVTANCLHPGMVATGFGRSTMGWMGSIVGLAMRFGLSPEQGAATSIYLATSPAVADVSGEYFADRQTVWD
jgi:NAD(P)-dependent dehydrogenase (short-subunit alcohol dehydrogenase family)